MFPSVIARASPADVISSGLGGTNNGALQLVSPSITHELLIHSSISNLMPVAFGATRCMQSSKFSLPWFLSEKSVSFGSASS